MSRDPPEGDSGMGRSPTGAPGDFLRGDVMGDLLSIGLMVAFFALAAAFVAACERIVGADTSYETPTEEVAEPHEAAA